MKRAFIILFTILIALYAKQGYEFLTSGGTSVCQLSGYLSDIAGEVLAIPLQKSREYNIRYAKHVRKEGDNLFLVCNGTLYRFNRRGELLRVITNPEKINVGGYIIDHRKGELIVFGNEDDIHYYTYDGELVDSKKLKSNIRGERICSMAMHNNNIWTTEECITHNPDTNQTELEVLAVRYDTSFNKLESKKIVPAKPEHGQLPPSYLHSEFCVNRDSGKMYLYSPPLSPEYLLSDTLYIINNPVYGVPGCLTAYPTQMGGRFWLAACGNNTYPLENYLFCYDTQTNRSWQLAEGFEDNYYNTGKVPRLHSMDIYNQNYYFCKSGDALSRSFPAEAHNEDLVIFIVKVS